MNILTYQTAFLILVTTTVATVAHPNHVEKIFSDNQDSERGRHGECYGSGIGETILKYFEFKRKGG
jgi:hypothetical protein